MLRSGKWIGKKEETQEVAILPVRELKCRHERPRDKQHPVTRPMCRNVHVLLPCSHCSTTGTLRESGTRLSRERLVPTHRAVTWCMQQTSSAGSLSNEGRDLFFFSAKPHARISGQLPRPEDANFDLWSSGTI